MRGRFHPVVLGLALAASAVALACVRPHGRSGASARSTPPLPAAPRCATVAGAELGRLPLSVEVGGSTVRLVEWTQGDETSPEVLGFAAVLPAGVRYTVQAGGERFAGSGSRWLHPRGLVGPRVHAIEAVEFCEAAGGGAGPGGKHVALR